MRAQLLGGGSSAEISSTFIGAYSSALFDPVSRESYDFEGMSFGAAHVDRTIVVAVGVSSGAQLDPYTVEIGGVSATVAGYRGHTGTVDSSTFIAYADVPTGTSGTITVAGDGSNSMLGCVIGVFRLVAPTITLSSSSTDTAAPLSTSVSLAASGCIVAVAQTNATASGPTWGSDLTIQGSANAQGLTSIGARLPAAAGSYTASCTFTGGNTFALTAACFLMG